jgi:hypothetical protein
MDYVAEISSFDAAERLLGKIEDKCKRLLVFLIWGRNLMSLL